MAEYVADPEIEMIGKKLVKLYDDVGHIECNRVLWLSEIETRPGSGSVGARCYSFGNHPVTYFTPHIFCIVVYRLNVDYMTQEQLAILIYHEMLHIPTRGHKLVDHDRNDFRRILGIHLDWHQPGRLVPDILKGGF